MMNKSICRILNIFYVYDIYLQDMKEIMNVIMYICMKLCFCIFYLSEYFHYLYIYICLNIN